MTVARNIFIMMAPPAAAAAAPAASFQNLENRARIEQRIVLARWMEVKLGVRTKTSLLFLPTQGHVFVLNAPDLTS